MGWCTWQQSVAPRWGNIVVPAPRASCADTGALSECLAVVLAAWQLVWVIAVCQALLHHQSVSSASEFFLIQQISLLCCIYADTARSLIRSADCQKLFPMGGRLCNVLHAAGCHEGSFRGQCGARLPTGASSDVAVALQMQLILAAHQS